MSEAVSPAGKSQMLEIVLGSGPSVLAPLGIEPAPLEPIAPATTPWLVVPDERALRRLLAPDGHGCIVSQARVLTVERLLAECMGFISMPPQMPTAVERFLLMGSIAKAANKVPNSGMIATMLEVDRLGHEAVAPTWMASLIGRYREELSSRGKCSHRERLRLVLEELRSGPGSLLVRHLRAMVGFVRIEGFGFMDGDLAMLAQAMSENVRVEIRMDHPTDKTELELLILHFSDSLKIEPKGLCAIPAPAPLYAVTPSVVRLRQSFQQPLWVASKVMDILNASDHFPSVAVVVPSSAHAEKVRLALELAGMPVSCPAESTMPWDTRPGQFVNRILDFPAMPFLADIDRIVGDPWARESFKNFWLWPTLRRICGEYRTGLSPDGWKDFFISALEKWAEDDGTSEAEDEGKDLAKRSISAAFASQMELAETDHEANHPRSDGTGAAETEEPAQVTSKHGKAVQMAALAADLVMVMGMAARAKADLPSSPDGPRELARRLGALLDRIGISKRLSGFRRGALPAGAMETDQKAAAKIREALKGLFRADILPETLGADQAINLAMAAQRVRLSPKDSGCVQVLSPAMAAAESFDHVIVIGLESGCYESSLPDQALCPPIERKRVRNQLASQLKSTCRQARRNAWLVWSEADKEQKQVKGCFLDEIEATFGTRRLPELVPDEVVLHRKPVDSFRVENARAWSERLDRLSRHLATSASLSGRPSWLPRVMELAWPSSRHFSPTRLQNHHKCRYMFFSTETVGCRGFDSDDTDRFEGHYIHRIMELAVQQARAFPPPRDSITRAAELAWPEYRDVLGPELEGLGTRLADMLDKCKELSGVTWHAASGSTEEPLAFEMTDADGASFMVRLRIDVLLRGSISSDSRSIVLDYKRSMPKQADRQVADGTLLEPLVYIEAVRHCKGIAQDKLDMALLQLKPKESAKLQWVRMDDAWVAITPGISVPPVGGLLGIVSRSVSEVRKGIYGLTVLDSGEHPSKPCSYFCPARHACRHLRQPVRLREDW